MWLNLLILFIILFTYFFLIIILNKKNVLEKYNISLYGPALLLRTKRGISFLKKISNKKRFWKAFGSFGIVFCFIMMILMIMLLIFQTWTVIGFTPEQKEVLPGIEFGLLIPGINPILPIEYIVYILLALIVAVIVHEFSHGILTFSSKLKVKSLGILYLIVPLGAFCEPDEKQLRKTKTSNRMRVYAAGPTSNFAVVLISLLIFSFIFMSAVQPIEGTHVFYVVENTPADEIDLSPGTVLTYLNDTKITNLSDFYDVIGNTAAGQNINISYFKEGSIYSTNITLANRYNYTKNETHKNLSFLGVGFNPYGGYISVLKNPFKNDISNNLILLYALPFFGYISGYNPIASPFTDSLVINGPLSIIPDSIFWGIVNTLYWIFWLNLAVGLFNVLPIIPLDGGILFNDALKSFINIIKKNISEDQRDRIAKNISAIISLLILFIVLFPWIIRYF
jgi:membrane-associated protease RseP (regulator of RpoE activity)